MEEKLAAKLLGKFFVFVKKLLNQNSWLKFISWKSNEEEIWNGAHNERVFIIYKEGKYVNNPLPPMFGPGINELPIKWTQVYLARFQARHKEPKLLNLCAWIASWAFYHIQLLTITLLIIFH